MGGHNFDPFDCLADFDRTRREKGVLNNAIDIEWKEGHVEHAEAIREEKGEERILCINPEKEERIEKVARVEKPSKPTKKRRRLGVKQITSKRWLREHNLKEAPL